MTFFAFKTQNLNTKTSKNHAKLMLAFLQKRSVVMIEIVTKNVEQIGRPSEDDRIYISDKAYKRVHQEGLAEKSVYVLMGHTESSGGKYATFIEAAIPVWDIEFERNVPIWNNHVWSAVFQEIKRNYDESIIVGWAYDRKGFYPECTPDIERIHREQFGGAHQLLFLVDTLQSDEKFYINKNNHLCERQGFFIYYKMEVKPEPVVDVKVPEEVPLKKAREQGRARYRQSMVQAPAQNESTGKGMSIVIVAMVAIMVILVGVTLYSKGFSLTQKLKTIETFANQSNEIETQIPVEKVYR